MFVVILAVISTGTVFCIFEIFGRSAAKYGEKRAVNESAASEASRDCVKFQAVIKSAASAASPKAKSREGSSRGAPRAVARSDPSSGRPCRPTVPRRQGAPLELASLDSAFGEAALAADLITA